MGGLDKWWEKTGLKIQYEKVRQWQIVNYGKGDESAVCECCGASLSRSTYVHRHSLPLACPKCRVQLHGFKTAEGDG